MDKEIKEFKKFVDALSGKNEIDYVKTIFSDDDRIHYKKASKHHDSSLDEFDSAEEFAEEYEDDFDDEDEAIDEYEDEY